MPPIEDRNSKHIILHAPPFWGHNKALVALAVFIARARPKVLLSLITTSALYLKIVEELEEKLETEELETLKTQINIIDIVGTAPVELAVQFSRIYEAIYSQSEQGITCMSCGKTLLRLPQLVVAIIDPYAGYAYEAIHIISRDRVPIISWLSAPTAFLLHHIGPRNFGGHAPDIFESEEGRKEVKSVLSRSGNQVGYVEPHVQLLSSMSQLSENEKIMVPGVPPMFVYELTPQTRPSTPGKLIVIGGIYIRESDGIIMASNSAYEGETMHAIKDWFQQMGRSAFAVAPLKLPQPRFVNRKIRVKDEELFEFLERIRNQFGPRSLIYISFGTFAYPPQPEKLQVLIEALIAHRKPFLFSHPSPQATPGKIQALIKESEIGLAMLWSPQEVILQHEATGWFITHGGWNSIQESFEHEVPLIFWPISADQPLNAAHLVITHQAAFELIGVRSGEQGTRPLLRFQNTGYNPDFTVNAVRKEVQELLERIDGEKGRAVRTNFNKLCKKMRKSWDKRGESNVDFEQFLERFVDGT